jgi:DNA-directed RNA polymerase specialized sigma24 family protein
LWQKGRAWRKSDEQAYFDYFKPQVVKVAAKMILDYRLPESSKDDLISDGLLALARVPKENRWSGKYVYTAIINRMRDGLQQARTRWSRYELWAELPEVAAPDGIDGRIAMRELVDGLEGVQADVVVLFLQGYDNKEIAKLLKVDPAVAKEAYLQAVELMRQRINSKEETK